MTLHKIADDPREEHHEHYGDDHRRDHDLDLLGHADGGKDRIQGKDDIQQHNLHDDTEKRAADASRCLSFAAFELLVDLMRALGNEKQATAEEDQIAPGQLIAKNHQERRREADDPRQREQQSNTHQHGQAQPDKTGFLGLIPWQLSGQDRDKNDVIDAKDEFERHQGDERDPDLRVCEPFHWLRLLTGTASYPYSSSLTGEEAGAVAVVKSQTLPSSRISIVYCAGVNLRYHRDTMATCQRRRYG